ncbi:antitoxin Xre/MbcA/ParS toxin-binding domain-containing protein [Pseudomonas amygdali]|uniref:antitoxin Xre/MbcA/ParS toxin-binding domain-containing protein n=1 Tax=Pseudomonas amygdali TaxID=47877 RepID=UPI001C55A3E4|nr:antitoxin Xre/MbcA/ParS toxin-binding domain-containing protein [Pseudomonas amygdali]QXW42688.1 DUF2384 domain-containing protein [Pseudomonas amygdali]
MLIELDLNMNDAESLLRHCADFQPASGDAREDSRLSEALASLASAIKDSMNTRHCDSESMEVIDPKLLEAAIGLLQDQALATSWLRKPKRALGDKSPIDVPIEKALTLIARLEHGIWA